jgi:hypothetical protein
MALGDLAQAEADIGAALELAIEIGSREASSGTHKSLIRDARSDAPMCKWVVPSSLLPH